MAASWLKNAVFYEIYPQTFYDTNGDGIGDLPGVIEKLPYVKSLGCNAIWMNPCFDSPFKDAGYDVRNYYKVAERYGTNEDLVRLFDEAHKLGIHILLDLVPGHTSEEHEWFQQSKQIEKNEYSSRYIWTKSVFEGAQPLPFIAGDFVQHWKKDNWDISVPVVDAIQAVCRNCGSGAFVQTGELCSNTQQDRIPPLPWEDTIHFSRDALYILGRRYFDAFIGLLNNK